MSRLESIDSSNLEGLIKSPYAVLVLAKTGCPACQSWGDELTSYLDDPEKWPQVRFGKALLDKPGLARYKRDNPWLAEVDVLPYNVIYVNGEIIKSYAGGGIERLENRLRRIFTS